MEQIVTGCSDCPMFIKEEDDRYGDMTYCQHPKHESKTVNDIDLRKDRTPITPDWCTLKKEPITISIKE